MRHRSIFKLAGKILYGAALAFVFYYLWKDLRTLSSQQFEFNSAAVLLSFLATTAGNLLNLLMWYQLTRIMGIELPLLRTARAWSVSRLGRYVPGKIPFLLMRLAEYSIFSKRIVAVAFALEYFLGLLAACIIVSLALAFARYDFPLSLRITAGAGLIALCLLLYPPLCKRFCNTLLAIVGRDPIDSLPSVGSLIYLAMWCIGVALVHGLGFFLLLNSLSPIPFSDYLLVTGVYYAAGLIGIAVLIAPGGLGVTEGVLFVVLPKLIPLKFVALAAIGIRVTYLISEVLAAAVFFSLERIQSKNTRNLAHE